MFSRHWLSRLGGADGRCTDRSRRYRSWLGHRSRSRYALRNASRAFESLEPRALLAADFFVTEFMASNDVTIFDEDGDSSDWIEVANTGDVPGTLDGWHLTDNATNLTKWQFPDVTVQPGEYLVVWASNKDRTISGQPLHTDFKLGAGGEYLALVEPDGTTVKSEFAPTFPPQFADISYGLTTDVTTTMLVDVSSAPEVLIPTIADAGIGTTWTEVNYATDPSWIQGTSQGVGYDLAPDYGPLIGTDVQTEMYGPVGQGLNASAMIRIPFTAGAEALDELTLRIMYDDGFAAFLNGQPLVSDNGPTPLAWNSQANADRIDSLASQFATFDVSAQAGLVQPGNNVLAIHGLNVVPTSSVFLILAELEGTVINATSGQPRYFSQPSPGVSNAQASLDTTPFVSEVAHTPSVPLSAEDITVTAKVVEQGAPLSSATLTYRVMYGGEVDVTMFDDGSHGDGLAGDGVYGGVIPSSATSPGEMVRWYVTAENTTAESARFPLFASSPDAPAYDGTIIADPVPYTTSQLPVHHWFVQNPTWYQNGNGTNNKNETSASLFYNGVFYDNIHVRVRGETADSVNTVPPKLKFRFNDEYEFRFSPDEETVPAFNTSIPFIDNSYIRQELGWEVFRETGAYAPLSFPVHTRQNGQFYGLSFYIERINKPFLRRNDLDSAGAVYKAQGVLDAGDFLQPEANLGTLNGMEKHNRDEIDASFSDLQAFVNGIHASNGATTRWNFLFDNVNIPEVLDVLSAYTITKHFDRNAHNYFVYRDSDGNGEWSLIPWDTDTIYDMLDEPIYSSFFDGHPGSGASDFPSWTPDHWNHLIDAIVDNPTTLQMYARRLRSLMDQILQPPGTPPAELRLENRADELGARLAPEAAIDYLLWGLKDDNVSWVDPGPYPAGLALIKQSFADRRDYLYTDPSLAGLIPSAQVGNPQIDFGVVEFNPASANQDQEYIELVNNNSFAVDLSGWQLTGGVTHTFAPGTVIVAGGSMYVSPDVVAFRARTTGPGGGQQMFVQGDYSGHLSNFGETLNLLAADDTQIDSVTYAGNPSLAQLYLRISEINYNPYDAMTTFGDANVAAGEFEFIELVNTSSADTLDLTGVQFIAGVTFDFTGSAVTSLAPGVRTVVVKNQSAFESRYGTGLNVAGIFATGSLANGGEALKIDDATGSTIQQFSYNDSGKWPGRADGKGATLEVVDPSGDYNDPENWRSSNGFHGTPAAPGSGPVYDVIVNEVLSHSDGAALDKVELYNTTGGVIDLEGWHLTDTHTDFLLHTFAAGASIAPGGYLVLDENELGFALDGQLGDDIWLMQGDPADGGKPLRFADHHDLDATETDISLGRVPNGDPTAQGAALFPVIGQSFGTANGSVVVGDVVISEVFYHTAPLAPPNLDIDDDELDFVELYNRSGGTVDVSDWRLRQNDGSDLTLPTGTTIAAGETVVLVRFDPVVDTTKAAAFRAEHGIGGGVALVGLALPDEMGGLNNSGEEIELLRPEEPANPLSGYLLVNRVAYNDTAPWPTGADGLGESLTRTVATNYGNFVVSWVGATPSPGSTSFAPLPAGDMTGDGLVNLGDVNLIVMALVNPSAYAAAYPHLDANVRGDADENGTFDLGDISAFAALFGPPATASAQSTDPAAPPLAAMSAKATVTLAATSTLLTDKQSTDALLTVLAGRTNRDELVDDALASDVASDPDATDQNADIWDLALLDLLS